MVPREKPLLLGMWDLSCHGCHLEREAWKDSVDGARAPFGDRQSHLRVC